ncbi:MULTISPECIES: hypothetical protein [unclassified Pseudofrankia]|uniref:hypothetical protein n=1 Tax=unclassified Pseudofrankia TaxID=2994372 RepID=UPI0008DB2B94|nr:MULTISPECIES: hypothetical protein [unclassified Pseudofrankia]MDT3445768.1 hypothetical protein [Pseudofrankia sp. BMG5.37]OHV62777.1 hypothetical protein BCD48_39085 [Pseudofrankia sp. BMG5.36]
MPVTVFAGAPSDTVAPGVTRSRLEPGGAAGPGGVVRDSDQIGGGAWSQMWSLGRPEDPWRMLIPDIRMAANQIWPLHWHDCWTVVVVLDGGLLMGDWWMERGDVLLAAPGVEYGPLVNGPRGSELLEIFAQDVLSPGGYGEEYRDHPTLKYVKGLETTAFFSRPPRLVENGRRQVVPIDETTGLWKGRLDGKAYWDLGDRDNPERGVAFDVKLAAGATRPGISVGDWRGVLVFDGSATVGDTELATGDVLLVEPDAKLPDLTAGPGGVHLLELARTAAALAR